VTIDTGEPRIRRDHRVIKRREVTMSRFRHDMQLAMQDRARRAPAVIDLDPSQWHELGRPRARATATAGFWIAAAVLLFATVAAPLVNVVTHHAL
jgi:hypothetical protein